MFSKSLLAAFACIFTLIRSQSDHCEPNVIYGIQLFNGDVHTIDFEAFEMYTNETTITNLNMSSIQEVLYFGYVKYSSVCSIKFI